MKPISECPGGHEFAFEDGDDVCQVCGQVRCHPADHEWECDDDGYTETCAICGEIRDYDGAEDDGRDFTPPYEP